MDKTLTLRLDEPTYQMFKRAAEGDRRTLANFVEYATYAHILNAWQVSDDEMVDILKDAPSLRKGLNEAKKGKYSLVK